MKELLILILNVSIILGAEKLYLVHDYDTSFSYSDTITGYITSLKYSYDSLGKINCLQYIDKDLFSGKIYTKEKNIYTPLINNSDSSYHYYWSVDDNSWHENYKTYNRYDDNGNCLEEKRFKLINGEYILTGHYKQLVLNNKKFDSHEIFDSSGSLTETRVSSYTYNENGLLTSTVHYDSSKENSSRSSYQYMYDSLGRLTTEHYEEVVNSILNRKYKIIQRYENEKITTSTYTTILNDSLEYHIKESVIELNHDGVDSLIWNYDYNSKKGEWILTGRQHITVNAKGNITKELRESWNGAEFIKSYINEATYVQDSLMTYSSTQIFKDNKLSGKSVSYQTYKTLNQLVPILSQTIGKSFEKVQISRRKLYTDQSVKEIVLYNVQGRFISRITGKEAGAKVSFSLPLSLGKSSYVVQFKGSKGEKVHTPMVITF